MKAVLPLISLLMLSGCATHLPDAIRTPPDPDISIVAVRDNPSAYKGNAVRWGGRIAMIENRADETWIDIVARELDSDGRPRETDDSHGRFIARVLGFLDPAIYTKTREITVAGKIEGDITRAIGEHPYRYVLVDASSLHLWQPRIPPDRYRTPYDDPFWYDPFWPWRPYPRYAPYPFW